MSYVLRVVSFGREVRALGGMPGKERKTTSESNAE
jgi:hypothetical protein